jgi:DNA polymerase zeta
MSVFALEIFGEYLLCRDSLTSSVNSASIAPPRGDYVPDPDVDDIIAVFWSFQDPADELADNIQQRARRTGIIVVENKQFHPSRLRDFFVEVVDTELELLNQVVDVVMNLDPDIVTGWEIQAASWGYLSARGRQYG